MSLVKVQGNASGTGTLTIAAPNTNTNQTLTLPDQTGTFMVTGPAFSAYANGGQTITASTFTKMQCSTEQFDTNSNFNNTGSTVGSTPAYAFLPTVAGYYSFNAQASLTATNVARIIPTIYKNGAAAAYGNDNNATVVNRSTVNWIAYMNGSTDYVEFYVYATGTGTITTTTNGSLDNYFQAVMVRGA